MEKSLHSLKKSSELIRKIFFGAFGDFFSVSSVDGICLALWGVLCRGESAGFSDYFRRVESFCRIFYGTDSSRVFCAEYANGSDGKNNVSD